MLTSILVFSISGVFCIYLTRVSKFQLNVDHTAMHDIVLLLHVVRNDNANVFIQCFTFLIFFHKRRVFNVTSVDETDDIENAVGSKVKVM